MLENAILITGAGQRIGLHLAHKFLAETAYPLVFTYRTHHQSIDELQSLGALGFQVDFCDASSVQAFMEELPKQISSLRVLVHNASLWIPEADLGENGYQQLFAVHMQAPYDITQACIPLLRNSDQEMKDIIAVTDWKSQLGNADYAAYLSTKAGLESLMQSFARKLAPEIKANSISPGLVMFNEGDSDEYKQKRLGEMANPKEIGPESIWQAVQFLMHSSHSTGSKIELGHLRSRH